MGLFDFFKKKATEEQPQTEEQQEGVLELDGVEVETDAQEADIVLDVEDGQDMNRAVHAVMDEEEIQIDRAGEDILYRRMQRKRLQKRKSRLPSRTRTERKS